MAKEARLVLNRDSGTRLPLDSEDWQMDTIPSHLDVIILGLLRRGRRH